MSSSRVNVYLSNSFEMSSHSVTLKTILEQDRIGVVSYFFNPPSEFDKHKDEVAGTIKASDGIIIFFSLVHSFSIRIDFEHKIALQYGKQIFPIYFQGDRKPNPKTEPVVAEFGLFEFPTQVSELRRSILDLRRPLRAFISYKLGSDAENEWVEKFATDLRKRGIDATIDKWEVRYGDSFTDYMTSRISEADIVFVIITDALVSAIEAPRGNGGAVKLEVQMAVARRTSGEDVRVVGIYRQGARPPAHLRDHRYADFRNDSLYSQSMADLMEDLNGITGKPPLG